MYEDESELSVWRNLMEDGTKCLSEEEYHEAENCYLRGLQIAHQLTVPEIVAFTIRLLATVRVRLEKLDLAEQGFQEALGICLELQNGKGMSEAWAGLASVSVKKGMFRNACKEYEQAISVYPNESPPLRLGMLYADLGQVYARIDEGNKAQKAYKKARDICRMKGFPKGEGELEVLLGELSYRQGKKKEAVKNLKRACQIFALIADTLALTNTLQYLALIYFDQNEMYLAFECQQRAVALCLKFDDENTFSESCFFLSKIEQFLENYEEAKHYLELSIRFYSKQDLDLALRYQNLAGLFLIKLDLAKAELYYLKALSLFESINDETRIGEVFEALSALKEIKERKENLTQTPHHSYYKSKLNEESELEALVRLAEAFEKKRRFRDALDCYWKALEIGRKAEIITDWIETRVQRVSKRLRGKIYR
jgi:Tetratricopeptide repeat.